MRTPLDRTRAAGQATGLLGSVRSANWRARDPSGTNKSLLKKTLQARHTTKELAMQHLQVVNVVMLIEPMEIGQHIWKAVAEAVNYSAALILNVYTHDGLPNDGVNTRVVLIPR